MSDHEETVPDGPPINVNYAIRGPKPPSSNKDGHRISMVNTHGFFTLIHADAESYLDQLKVGETNLLLLSVVVCFQWCCALCVDGPLTLFFSCGLLSITASWLSVSRIFFKCKCAWMPLIEGNWVCVVAERLLVLACTPSSIR